MPVLPNPKHERFAQAIAKGKSQAEAYEAAGYAPSEPHASRLASDGKVRARIAELQAKGAERVVVTLESLLVEAADIQAKALAAGQFAPAVSAMTAKAKLAGLWVEKRENTNRNVDASRVPDNDLAAIATSGSEGASEAPINPARLN